MPNKPITQGYKIYGIADHGYLYNFLWSSREKGLQDILLRPGLTKTGCLIRNLTLSLPRRRLTIYIDNYFTSMSLFIELRACNFGAVGIIRPHKEFLDELIKLKTQYIIKLE
jgi:Transposase IS4